MRRSSQCLLAVIAVCTAGHAAARTEVLKTRAGSPVHWTRAEILVGIDAKAGSRYLARLDVVLALERAARAWNRIPASQPRFRFTPDPGQDVTISFCRGKWQGAAIDLGRTQFVASPTDGSVTSATVELNECDHQFTPPGETAEALFDLQSVIAHELGHVLGLGHGDKSTAIMFPNGEGAVTRFPQADDVTALALIYLGREPLAGFAPLAAAEPAGALLSPTAWTGTTVSQAAAPETVRPATGAAPADSVSVMNVKAGGGHEVMIFTGEPTLLPAIADVQASKGTGRSASRHAKAR